MIRFDFKTYTKQFINQEKYQELLNKKEEVLEKFRSSYMNGWTNELPEDTIEKIKNTAEYIKNNFDCLVVIGIGGSYLGSYSFNKLFQKYFKDDSFEIIYAGTTLSSKYLDECLDYLKDKNFCINVISKSGTTMETNVTYKLLKDVLKRKYSKEELRKNIIITTDKQKGTLRKEVEEEGYISFEIPDNIGGRYSFITPAHLLPLAINYNLKDIIDGYFDGKRYIDQAYEYAVTRKLLFDEKKYIENYCVYENNMLEFTEWLKQLFGETEGKNGVGIFPVSTLHTRDLHSLGQFIQEGNKIIFETFIKVLHSDNYIEYQGRKLQELNNIVLDSVMNAHFMGKVPCMEIEIKEIDEETISSLIYFFMLSAAFSAFLFGVDPFNQPGVEIYKSEIKKSLEN